MRSLAAIVIVGMLLSSSAWGQGVPTDRVPERQTDVGPYDVPAPPEDRPSLRYDPGDPIPPGFHVERGYHTALLASGIAVFAFNYALSVVAARAEVSLVSGPEGGDRNMQPLYVPLTGPFIALGGDGWADSERALLAVDGIAQVSGFALMMAGLLVRESYLVYGEHVARRGVALKF